MNSTFNWLRSLVVMGLFVGVSASFCAAQPVKSEVLKTETGWQLIRGGKPFFIQGAGGDASKSLLVEVGGNSFRTWDAAGIDAKLDEAHRLGLAVTVGMWMGHESRGFNYNDAEQVAKQKERCRQAVLRYKDHPAVLMWAVGNEMEGEKAGDNPAIWRAVNDVAAMIKSIDANHPTMTVIVEVGGERVRCVHEYCPAIDVVGINSYGGAPTVAKRYRKAGGTKPYVVTEFGPAGVWEVRDKQFGQPVEQTSTAKERAYRDAWMQGVAAERDRLCLGGYAFAWGSKQEATATWYGLVLPDGKRTGAVDVLRELWTGKKADWPCPRLKDVIVTSAGGAEVKPGEELTAEALMEAPAESGRTSVSTVRWELHRDSGNLQTGGETQAATRQFPEAIVRAEGKGCTLRMPRSGGIYRLYAFVQDDRGGAAVGNVLLKVSGPVLAEAAERATLPVVIDEGGMEAPRFFATGFMGNHKAVRVDRHSEDKPRVGRFCIRCEYRDSAGWAGVTWQDPANDWGDRPGGLDLTGAKRMTFWARGEKGGETLRFTLGGIGGKKAYPDTARGEVVVTLGTDWKRYEIELTGQDLSRVKTPFAWVTKDVKSPMVFYLDEIRYE